MSDDIKLDQENDQETSEELKLQSRRKFAKSGIAGGAVLMSLLSRPALAKGGRGGNDAKCTGSILASIDAGTSLHDFDPRQCRFGCTPGFWCYGQGPDIKAWEWIVQNTNITGPNMQFVDLFGVEPAKTPELIAENFPNGTTLNDIICIPNGEGPAFIKQSARHAIAAVLNAHILGTFYAQQPNYSADNIINMYLTAYALWNPEDPESGDALAVVHETFASLNEWRDCPLDNNIDNYFYQQGNPLI